MYPFSKCQGLEVVSGSPRMYEKVEVAYIKKLTMHTWIIHCEMDQTTCSFSEYHVSWSSYLVGMLVFVFKSSVRICITWWSVYWYITVKARPAWRYYLLWKKKATCTRQKKTLHQFLGDIPKSPNNGRNLGLTVGIEVKNFSMLLVTCNYWFSMKKSEHTSVPLAVMQSNVVECWWEWSGPWGPGMQRCLNHNILGSFCTPTNCFDKFCQWLKFVPYGVKALIQSGWSTRLPFSSMKGPRDKASLVHDDVILGLRIRRTGVKLRNL